MAFVMLVPVIHFMAVTRYASCGLGTGGLATCYDILGLALVLGAIWLTSLAAQQLGKVKRI